MGRPAPMLPPDNHVHTEWSWDAYAGSMEQSCARALELGLPSIARYALSRTKRRAYPVPAPQSSIAPWPASL